ncbi:MAG: hypothetical protein FD167_3488 [bacterium]|nr:MAG: hypothetical protein FD167_3488 [bacterium]
MGKENLNLLIPNLITNFESNPTLANLVILSNTLVLANRGKEIVSFILKLDNFEGDVLGAVKLGVVDNSSIEGMHLTAWKLPLELGNSVIVKIQDTFPYSTPQNTIKITTTEPNDRVEINRIGKAASNFISLDTTVKCYRSETLIWSVDFNINSHWGGITDAEVIAIIKPIAEAARAEIEIKDLLF